MIRINRTTHTRVRTFHQTRIMHREESDTPQTACSAVVAAVPPRTPPIAIMEGKKLLCTHARVPKTVPDHNCISPIKYLSISSAVALRKSNILDKNSWKHGEAAGHRCARVFDFSPKNHTLHAVPSHYQYKKNHEEVEKIYRHLHHHIRRAHFPVQQQAKLQLFYSIIFPFDFLFPK